MTAVHPALARADGLIGLERYDEAAALLGRRVAEDPDDLRAWVTLARCLLGAGEPAKALQAADTALTLDPHDVSALIERARGLRGAGARWEEAETAMREVVRLAPEYWYGYALLADTVFRGRVIRHGQAHGGRVEAHEMDGLATEATELAREALRLGPETVYAHEVAQTIADISGKRAVAEQLDEAILRLDPQHAGALARRADRRARAGGARATEAATLYADALAVAPSGLSAAWMRRGLDSATYRLLRGTRWLALLCLVLAGSMLDLFAADGAARRELPVPVGNRLWTMVPMAAIWAFGAWRRYRRLRLGVQLTVRSLVRRSTWARIALGQAAWAMLCALLLTEVPWAERTVPVVLFWAGMLPTAATIPFDQRKI